MEWAVDLHYTFCPNIFQFEGVNDNPVFPVASNHENVCPVINCGITGILLSSRSASVPDFPLAHRALSPQRRLIFEMILADQSPYFFRQAHGLGPLPDRGS